MYEVMTLPEIRKWLASLIKKVGWRGRAQWEDRLTLDKLAKQTGIPLNTLKWLVYKDTAKISLERQRVLSKIAAEYENGLVVYKGQKSKESIAVVAENPRPILRYGFAFGPRGPTLKPVDRPKVQARMPTMKDLLGG